MRVLSAFAPWIVYWVLVGNVPFATAVLVALALAVASFAIGRASVSPVRTFEVGSIATFLVLAVLTFTLNQSFMERWILTLSAAGILLVALAGVLTGTPFMRVYVAADQPAEVVNSESFDRTTTSATWIWVTAFVVMTVSVSIPPIASGDTTILDRSSALSFLCSWVVPFVLVGAAVLVSQMLIDRMVAAALHPDVVRRTTFVAFRELAIDELCYLAQQKADREVGAGMEAYAVQVGGKGIPLTGDDSRESWSAMFKVRQRR